MNIRKWSIQRANLDPVIGAEQGKSRPVLVISEDTINELLNTVNVIPITSRKPGRKVYPNETLITANNFGLEKQRLSVEYGHIASISVQAETLEALSFQLGIDRN